MHLKLDLFEFCENTLLVALLAYWEMKMAFSSYTIVPKAIKTKLCLVADHPNSIKTSDPHAINKYLLNSLLD